MNTIAQLPSETDKDTVDFQSLPVRLESDDNRVITLPFMAGSTSRLSDLVQRILGLSDDEVDLCLTDVRRRFNYRHEGLDAVFIEHFGLAARLAGLQESPTRARQELIGSYFTTEYSFQSTALFNPSIAAHPDQTNLPEGAIRFIMSLRATGEGHVSCAVFRTGVIRSDGTVSIDDAPSISARTRLAPDHTYHKEVFRRKLDEMSVDTRAADLVLTHLPDAFNFVELEQAIEFANPGGTEENRVSEVVDSMLWLARSNYQLKLSPGAGISHLVIFPQTDNEARGIEDVRLVRFRDDEGSITYYGTYTAYNGIRTLPMLFETADFSRIRIHTLNGACAVNKGMALFPRKIDGHYVMCGRMDGHSLYIMYSDMVHFWETATPLAGPKYSWELRLIGNCGSPIETDEGWLLLTHGVGPMRQYSIGAMLLDQADPSKMIGRLKSPLVTPTEEEREGYVPNVVYTCGAMPLGDRLYIPYAVADSATRMASVSLSGLLARIKRDGP